MALSFALRVLGMVRRGKLGDDAVTKEITVKENGVEVTKTVKVNPTIDVPNCLPEKLEDSDKTDENFSGLMSLIDKWDFVSSYWNQYQLSVLQNKPAEATGEYADFFKLYPEFVSANWPNLEGEALAKAKTAFCTTITRAANSIPGFTVKMILNQALAGKGITPKA